MKKTKAKKYLMLCFRVETAACKSQVLMVIASKLLNNGLKIAEDCSSHHLLQVRGYTCCHERLLKSELAELILYVCMMDRSEDVAVSRRAAQLDGI